MLRCDRVGRFLILMMPISAFFMCLSARASQKKVNNIAWLAYGDLRGHIEPCGCDPRTDLGGILRLGTLVSRDRALGGGAKVFDLGNNLSEEQQESTKNTYINKGLDELKPDAALVNAIEYRLKAYSAYKRNFVLSNFSNPAPTRVHSVWQSGNVSIYGYLWIDGTQKDLLPWQQSFGPSWRRELEKRPESYRILLFSGPDAQLQEILSAKIFDEVIAANRAPLSAVIIDDEKLKPGLLLRDAGAQAVFQTPLGGQGVLRGGPLRQLHQKPLSELLGRQSVVPTTLSNMPRIEGDDVVTWLTPNFVTGSPLATVMESYRKSRGQEFKVLSQKRLGFLKQTPFAGADQCKSCHEPAWQVWKKAAHPHAYQTLVGKGKEEDPECVSCHVLGFTIDGGFVSKIASPEFAGVQCENCHGPGLAHTRDPKVKLSVPSRTVCISCHKPPHTADFKFDVYWEKIRHG